MSGEYEKAISIGKAIQNIVSRRYSPQRRCRGEVL